MSKNVKVRQDMSNCVSMCESRTPTSTRPYIHMMHRCENRMQGGEVVMTTASAVHACVLCCCAVFLIAWPVTFVRHCCAVRVRDYRVASAGVDDFQVCDECDVRACHVHISVHGYRDDAFSVTSQPVLLAMRAVSRKLKFPGHFPGFFREVVGSCRRQ